MVDLRAIVGSAVNPVERPAEALPAADKVAWLREVDDAARSFSPEVDAGRRRLRRLAAARADRDVGRPAGSRRRARASGWSRRSSPRATGTSRRGSTGPAACSGTEFVDRHPPRATAEVAARRAVTMLDSIPAPAGEMTVVARARAWAACCSTRRSAIRSRPTRSTRRRASTAGWSDERCATELIDGVDDATIPNGWGSYEFDDEATPSQRTVAVREGRAPGPALRPDARRQGRSAADGERAAAVLRVAADPADDEHEHPERHVEGRRHPVVHRERRLRHVARRRPGEPGDRRLRVRRRRGVPDRGRRGRRRRSAART